MRFQSEGGVGRVIAVFASSFVLGCSTPDLAGAALATPKPADVFQGVQCDAVRPQTEPDLMAWDPGSRANLSRLRKEGVVAVRYAQNGCNVELEVLSNCIGPGADRAYRYSAYSASQSKVARNAQELFAELPIGAARLTGKLKGNRALRTDYALVGTAALPPGKRYKLSDLNGECGRATHVVSVVYLGGFAMVAGEARELEAAGTVFGAGAGARTGAEAERLDSEGEASACDEAKKGGIESTLCAVPLRIGLMALLDAAPAPSSPIPLPGTTPRSVATPLPFPAATPHSVVAPQPAPPASVGLVGLPLTGSQIDVMGAVEFDTGSPTLRQTPQTMGVLTAMVNALRQYPQITRLRVESHTDSDGSESANLVLSERRAQAVVGFLVDRGVDSGRLVAVGCAARDPLAPNTSAENKQKNRRTEFDIEMVEGQPIDGATAACAPNPARRY